MDQLSQALHGRLPRKTGFYALVGVVLSLGGAAVYASMVRRMQKIRQLSAALEGDIRQQIVNGESAALEFKSTFRWDLRENRINRSLETVVLKTLAGYMNAQGGTLLIGVADDGSIVGLEKDYSALKKPDSRRLRAGADDLGGEQAWRGLMPVRPGGISFRGRA